MTSSAGSGRREQRRELGRCLDHLLEVVEHEQQLPLADVLGEAVLGAERLGDRLRDERGVAERREADPEDARLEARDELAAASIASRVLPVPPGPVSVTSRAPSSIRASTSASSRSRPTKELAGPRQVRVRDRLQRREAAVAELEDRDGLVDVLEPVLAEVGEPVASTRAAPSPREHDLAAVAGAATRAARWTSSPT